MSELINIYNTLCIWHIRCKEISCFTKFPYILLCFVANFPIGRTWMYNVTYKRPTCRRALSAQDLISRMYLNYEKNPLSLLKKVPNDNRLRTIQSCRWGYQAWVHSWRPGSLNYQTKIPRNLLSRGIIDFAVIFEILSADFWFFHPIC